jgi:hypothetical protein
MAFSAKRLTLEQTFRVPAEPSTVFPLLCPVRELDWIPGWNATVLYSASGLAENNCVFSSKTADRGDAVYVVTRYEPSSLIEFAIFYPSLLTEKLEIHLTPEDGKVTSLRWVRTYTALSPAGNTWLEQNAEQSFQSKMKVLQKSMEAYLVSSNKATQVISHC